MTRLVLRISFLLSLALSFFACEEDDAPAPPDTVEAQLVENVITQAPSRDPENPAPGRWAYFSFATGDTVSHSALSATNWDIAFRGTTIAINGGERNDGLQRGSEVGAAVLQGIFDEMETIPAGLVFNHDSEDNYAIPGGSNNGWYSYNDANHLITPIAGRVLAFSTQNGQVALMEILSYYLDAPAEPDAMQDRSGVYTFRYKYPVAVTE